MESSDLESETQETHPKKYHEAWRAVVSAGYVCFCGSGLDHDFLSFRSGILVPGGFGQRGTEGMLLAIKYARDSKVPFLGICLGFQLAVVEWARNVLGIHGKKAFVTLSCGPWLIYS